MKKSRTLVESFYYAFAGIAYAFRTQRNIRIHFFAGLLVAILAYILEFTAFELVMIFFTISLVIIAEMINTAIEATVDLITDKYHPLAKIAKNVAAGAVLVSAINAVIVGYIIFSSRYEVILKYFRLQ